jgi:hypothetical protein
MVRISTIDASTDLTEDAMARHRADQPEDALTEEARASDLDDEELESEDDELEADEAEADPADDPADEAGDEASDDRPADVVKFWSKVRIEPIEIALPRGVGYTLRAYRMSDTLGSDEPELADEDESPEDLADEKRAAEPVDEADLDDVDDEDLEDESDEDEEEDEDVEDEDELEDEAEEDEADEEDEEEEEEEPEPEEVPVFLTQERRLLLFRSPEGLVEFVRSGEASSLEAVDEWEKLRSDLTADHVVVAAEDRYELDLVVENLRGGHDAWDSELLIKAGEIARDLGHALRVDSVMTALSAGSPLDDLDEALRSAESGRIASFLARRKLRRIGSQQAALAWRSIIGKISTSVDWRD